MAGPRDWFGREETVTTVTITIDDPTGADSNLFFPSTALNQIYGTRLGGTTHGELFFRRFVNGLPDPSTTYGLVMDGFAIETTGTVNYDLRGFATSMELRRGPDTDNMTAFMHASITLDGG